MESEIVSVNHAVDVTVNSDDDDTSSEAIKILNEDLPQLPLPHESPSHSATDSEDTDTPSKIEEEDKKIKPKRKKQKSKPIPKKICDECGKLVAGLPGHKIRAHNSDPSSFLACPQCPMKFAVGKDLWIHFSKYHKDLNTSRMSSFTPYNKLNVPLLDINSSKTVIAKALQCADCEQEFSFETNLRRHYYFIHGQGADPDNHLRCDQCFKSFKQKATLDDHVRRVHEGKGFFCDLCPSRGDLQSPAKLWRHKVYKHGMTDLEPPAGVDIIQCEYCGEKMFRGLESHVKKNHPEEYSEFKSRLPTITVVKVKNDAKTVGVSAKTDNINNIMTYLVECPQCSKEIQPSSLKRHLRNVHGVGELKLFPCPQCSKEFKERYHLNDHIRDTHDDIQKSINTSKLITEKPHKLAKNDHTCNLCFAKFQNKFQARAHLASEHPSEYQSLEDGIIPELYFKCSQCSEKFTKDDELRSHVSSSHPDKCWKCPKCWKVLLNPEDFRAHYKAEHVVVPAVVAKLQGQGRKPSDNNVKLKKIGKMSVSCPICSMNLAFGSVQDHCFVAHGIKRKAKICPECKAVFRRRNHWANHMHTVHAFPIDKVLAESCELDEEDKSQVMWTAMPQVGKRRAKINKLKLKSAPKSTKKSGRPRKNIKIQGATDKTRPGIQRRRFSMVRRKSRKVGKYETGRNSDDSDEEQDFIAPATRKSGRTTKSKINWRSLVDSGSESDHSKSGTEYSLPPGVNLSEMKSCHVPLVRLTHSQIQAYLCSVKIIKVEGS